MGPAFTRLAPAEHAVSVEVVVNVIRAARLVADALDPVLRACGLTPGTFSVLDVLGNEDRPLPAKEVAARMVTPAQTLTSLIDTLQRDGLVRRIPNPNDRRSVLIELTQAGRTALTDAALAVIPVEVAMLASISPGDQHHLVTLLGHLQRAAHDAPHRAGSPGPA